MLCDEFSAESLELVCLARGLPEAQPTGTAAKGVPISPSRASQLTHLSRNSLSQHPALSPKSSHSDRGVIIYVPV